MYAHRKIKVGSKTVEALAMTLLSKNLVLLRGSKGYIMCGYLNMRAAGKFKDAAVKITGVSTIEDALRATVDSCTLPARRLGVFKGQPVLEALRLIA